MNEVETQGGIFSEIYRALVLLGAESDLLKLLYRSAYHSKSHTRPLPSQVAHFFCPL